MNFIYIKKGMTEFADLPVEFDPNNPGMFAILTHEKDAKSKADFLIAEHNKTNDSYGVHFWYGFIIYRDGAVHGYVVNKDNIGAFQKYLEIKKILSDPTVTKLKYRFTAQA